MNEPLRIAMIVSDEREVFRDYANTRAAFGTAPGALFEGFAGQADCELHVLSCFQQPVQSAARLSDNIFFHSLVVPKRGWLRSAYAGCVLAIRRKLRLLQSDIVHGQGTERYCALAAAYSGRPNLITLHGNQRRLAKLSRARPFTFDWMQARLEAWTLPRTGGVICLSSHTRKEVQPAAHRTWVIPNAVDPSFFALEHSPSAERTIVCVGNILALKNQIGLIAALDSLAAKTSFRLVFLGWTRPKDPYARHFAELVASRPWCRHEGFADRVALKSHLRSASAMILPSLEENCPMAILEAMAAGVPVIGANVGGIPDLIEDGVTGLLCDPQSAESMRKAVLNVLGNPTLAWHVGIAAREHALKRFLPSVIAKQHLDAYRDLLERN